MSKEAYGTYLQQRSGWFYFLYNIPANSIGKAGYTKTGKPIRQIKIALRTKDRREALKAIGPHIEFHTNLYPAAENNNSKVVNFENVVARAKINGLPYRPARELQAASLQDKIAILSDIVDARQRNQRMTPVDIAAINGTIDIPELTLTQAFARFKRVSPEKVMKKSVSGAHQTWRKFERSIEDYINRMGGDVDIMKLDRATAKDYRAKLVVAVMNGEFKSNYANKHMENIKNIIGAVFDEMPGEPKNQFKDLKRIEANDEGKGEPFTEEEVRAIREATQKAKRLGSEAKAMILLAQNTGCYVSELARMAPEDIILDAEVPHIKIRLGPYRKEMKTDERERDIPLIGVALDIMKQFPSGFEARFNKERGVANLNSCCWNFIKRYAPEKSFKSYRHRFGSLLRHRDDDTKNSIFSKDQIQDALMGHATPGLTGYYGTPVLLKQMKEALEKALPEDNR